MTATAAGADPPLLRLCLDLNVWCAALISTRRGRKSGSSPVLVEIVRRGMCPTGAVQLVISWGMLGRLQQVYCRDLAVDPVDAANYVRAIATLAAHGPADDPPYLVLGGTGIAALRDEEDAHVLDVAIAGRAHLIATTDLGDFAGYRADARDSVPAAPRHRPPGRGHGLAPIGNFPGH